MSADSIARGNGGDCAASLSAGHCGATNIPDMSGWTDTSGVREFVVSGGFGYGGIRVGVGGAAVPLDLRFPIKYCLNRFLVSKISSRLRLDNFCS